MFNVIKFKVPSEIEPARRQTGGVEIEVDGNLS
jgi:hypothetical protein